MEYRASQSGYVLRMLKGEMLVATLCEFAQKTRFQGGPVTAIGAIKNPRVGIYDLEQKKYLKKSFAGEFELLQLMGNISWMNNAPIAHCHITFGDAQFRVYGGHLFECEIALTAEVFVHDYHMPLTRTRDDMTGLNVLNLAP